LSRESLAVFKILGVGTEEEVGEGVEPCLVSLRGWRGEFEGAAWSNDDQRLAVKSWWHWVVVRNNADSFYGDYTAILVNAQKDNYKEKHIPDFARSSCRPADAGSLSLQ
jgi:hypothetical protein